MTDDINSRPYAWAYASSVRQAASETTPGNTRTTNNEQPPRSGRARSRPKRKHRDEKGAPNEQSRCEADVPSAQTLVQKQNGQSKCEAVMSSAPTSVELQKPRRFPFNKLRTMFTCWGGRSSQYRTASATVDKMEFDKMLSTTDGNGQTKEVTGSSEAAVRQKHATGDAFPDKCNDQDPGPLLCKCEQDAKRFLELISGNEINKLKLAIKKTFKAVRARDADQELPTTVPESLTFICEYLTSVLTTLKEVTTFEKDTTNQYREFYQNGKEYCDLIDAVEKMHSSKVAAGTCTCPIDHNEAADATAAEPHEAAATTEAVIPEENSPEASPEDTRNQQQQRGKRNRRKNRRGRNK